MRITYGTLLAAESTVNTRKIAYPSFFFSFFFGFCVDNHTHTHTHTQTQLTCTLLEPAITEASHFRQFEGSRDKPRCLHHQSGAALAGEKRREEISVVHLVSRLRSADLSKLSSFHEILMEPFSRGLLKTSYHV